MHRLVISDLRLWRAQVKHKRAQGNFKWQRNHVLYTKPRGNRQLPKRVSGLRTPTRCGDPRSTQPSRTLLWRLFTSLCSNIVLDTTLILPTPNMTGVLQFISGKRLREPMNTPHLRYLRHGGHVGPVLLWLIYEYGQQDLDGEMLRNNSCQRLTPGTVFWSPASQRWIL